MNFIILSDSRESHKIISLNSLSILKYLLFVSLQVSAWILRDVCLISLSQKKTNLFLDSS